MATLSKQECPSCEAQSLTRNNYFTGKLMVERDFTDEQHYFMEKLRLHHQRLHGTGVVCGLEIEQHSSPECQSRYVILHPGSAIDCCGKDILVAQPEVIDLYEFPKIQEWLTAIEQNTGDPDNPTRPPATLQLCLRYLECPTEDIPVLYDECGCDDTRCAPNRILESYALDLLVNPDLSAHVPHQPALGWATTISLAHSERVLLHEATHRLYVMTADDAGILYQISTDNHAIEASHAMNRRGLAMATSPDGSALYVLVADAGGIAAGDAELQVFDLAGTNLATGAQDSAPISGTDNSEASLQMSSDGRLTALFHSGARLRSWAPGLGDLNPDNSADLGGDRIDLELANDGVRLYSAGPGSSNIHRCDPSVAGFDPTTIDGTQNAATDEVSRVVTIPASGNELLVVLDAPNAQLRVIDPGASPTFVNSLSLAHQPLGAAISEGGHWGYVLVADGSDCFVQTVNLDALRLNKAVVAGIPYPVGEDSREIAISDSGRTLFIPYVTDQTVDDAGGVAVIEIDEANCEALLWPEACPECERPDCIVLATIANYVPGFGVLDMPDPLPDAIHDLTAEIARIDNRAHRPRLPSTQAIAEALACVLENCCRGTGSGAEQGPPGPQGPTGDKGQPGPPGSGIDEVDVVVIPCREDPFVEGPIVQPDGTRLLRLHIPTNCNPDLTHLCNISWFHDGTYHLDELVESGLLAKQDDDTNLALRLLLRFDAPVRAADVHGQSVRVELGVPSSTLTYYVEPQKVVTAGVFRSDPCQLERWDPDLRLNEAGEPMAGGSFANGIQVLIDAVGVHLANEVDLRVSVLGDFIRDAKGRAVDLNHLPDWLTNQSGLATAEQTGDGVPGGRFESWFRMKLGRQPGGVVIGPNLTAVTSEGMVDMLRSSEIGVNFSAEVALLLPADRVNVNTASRDELVAIRGIGPELAAAIINARRAGPIENEVGLMEISGIGSRLLSRIRNQITFSDGE